MSFRDLFPPPQVKAAAAVDSPCIKVCIMEDGLCVGCARTLEEIGAWGLLSPEERRAIMAALPARRAPAG